MDDMRWNLDDLYASFDSEELKRDIERSGELIGSLREWAENNLGDGENATQKIEEFIKLQNEFYDIFTRLYSFAELTLSVEARNDKALHTLELLEEKVPYLTEPGTKFEKWLGTLNNLDEIIAQSRILKEHEFYLKEIVERKKYLLSDREEVLIAKMKNTGSNAWAKLQNLLTSTLLVDITSEGEKKHLPLPVVRNMAYDKNPDIRREAYYAELKAYGKIEESSAACLNGIKGEVLTLSKMRGYDSVLDQTLINSRMDSKTLNSMLEAMRESLPVFHKYYRHKAKILGHNNGLPFYDLFAPVGNSDMKFTYTEARDFLVDNFSSFSSKMSYFIKNAFDNHWIDAEPREGKRGGAFCSNLHSIKQSRVLANFNGSFDNVSTLAHELGHAYHGSCLDNETYLNSDYPMPLAETASIFNETVIKNAALKQASKDEAFTILESDISSSGQIIVDIYSRFLFESRLFERRKESSLSVKELKDLMLGAQKEAYGDGLDHNILHPYMWINKSHYYYAGANFYNFPYAFGLLFAKGLYAEYLKMGKEFTDEYDRLLNATGKNKIADVAAMMNIDIHSTDFWRGSLKVIEQEIEDFISL